MALLFMHSVAANAFQSSSLTLCQPTLPAIRSRPLELRALPPPETDDDDYGFGSDADGPLLSSDRAVLYLLPLGFAAATWFFTTLKAWTGLDNNTLWTWAPLYIIFFIGGDWEFGRRHSTSSSWKEDDYLDEDEK